MSEEAPSQAPSQAPSLMGATSEAPRTQEAAPTKQASPPEVVKEESYSPFNIYEEGRLKEDFAKSFGEEDKGLKNFFKKYEGAEDPNKAFLQGIKNMQYAIGQKGFERPPEDAPESVVEEFRSKLHNLNGAPDKPEGYGLDKPPEGVQEEAWDAEKGNAYAGLFHKHSASPELVKELTAMRAQEERQAQVLRERQVAEQVEREMGSLKQEFGDRTSQVIEKAKLGAQKLGLDEATLNSIATTSNIVKALAKVTELTGEDRIPTNSYPSGNSRTPGEEAKAIVSDPSHPHHKAYWDATHPDHKRVVEMRSRLNQQQIELTSR